METTWFKFADLPDGLKAIAKVREIAWSPKVGDKGLAELLNPFRGNDELRPVMMGINADERGFTATDAHKVIHIPAEVPKAQHGMFTIEWKPNNEGRYPNYYAVVPQKNPRKYTLDLLRLDSFLAAADHYANKTTHQAVLVASGEETWVIGVNNNFMRQAIKTMRQLGHEHADLHASEENRAMMLTPVGKEPMLDVTVLIMPVMLNGREWIEDPDFGLGLASRYDLRTNTLENRDGTVTDTWTVHEGWQPSGNVTKERLAVIRNIVNRNWNVQIQGFCRVKAGKLTCTNLETTYHFRNCGLADGFYIPETEGMVPVQVDMLDDDHYVGLQEQISDQYSQLDWPVADLADRLDIAMVLKGNDDLRQQYSQQLIEVKNGRLSFTVTDAQGLYQDECNAPKGTPDFKILPTDVKSQRAFAKIWEGGTIRMRVYGTGFTSFENETDELIVRNLQSSFPDVKFVFDKAEKNSENAIILDKKEIEYFEKLTRPEKRSITIMAENNQAVIAEVNKKENTIDILHTVQLRQVKLPLPRKKLMLYMPAATRDERLKPYGFGHALFSTLKKIYVGRSASEFTVHYVDHKNTGYEVPMIVSNPTLPDWPDDHVLGSKQGGRPIVTITPGPAKAKKEGKQLEISPAAKKADSSIAIRARATATALKLKLTLMQMKY